MSYHVKSAFGGLLDLPGMPGVPSDELACLNKANASSQVMAIDNVINSLTKTWKPTGYFRPADVQELLNMLATEAEEAGRALAAAPLSTSDALEMKGQAFEDVLRKFGDRSQGYKKAIADAKASGANVINAPALKDWVIASMRAISDAYVTATVLHCRQTWIEKWLDRAYRGMAAIGAVAARIVGVAVKVGEGVVNAVDTAGSLAVTIVKLAPFAALGLGGYLLYSLMKSRA